MLIRLYNFTGDRRALHKGSKLNLICEMQGDLSEPSDVVNPVIYVDSMKNETGGFDPANCNYAYIQEFKRYYFIKDMKVISENIWELSMHSDVLMSFEGQIETLSAYGLRTASSPLQSPEIEDPLAPYNACDYVTRYDFSWSGGGTATFTLNNDRYVLVTSG